MRTALTAEHYESVADIAVCRDDRLVGLVPLEAVLSAPGGSRIESLMDPDPPVVAAGTDQEIAAWKAVHHGETSLAVVDASGGFVGLVPPRRLLAVLLAEHDEDLERSAGFCAAPPQHGGQAASPSGAASPTACPGSCSGSWARSPPLGS